MLDFSFNFFKNNYNIDSWKCMVCRTAFEFESHYDGGCEWTDILILQTQLVLPCWAFDDDDESGKSVNFYVIKGCIIISHVTSVFLATFPILRSVVNKRCQIFG